MRPSLLACGLAVSLLLLAALPSAWALDPVLAQRGRDLAARLQQGGRFTVVAFGDSLTDGMGTDGRHSFPRLFADCLAYRYPRAELRVIVRGHPGETTADALRRVEAEVLAEAPDLVLVQFGGNDKGTGRRVWDFRADLGRLLATVAARTNAVVLACLNPIVDDDPNNVWSQGAREVAAAAGVAAADLDRAIREGDPDSRGAFPYNYHPGDFTHVVMAKEVLRAFDEATGTVPAFTALLLGGATLSADPTPTVQARLRNPGEAPLECTVKLDYPDRSHEQALTLRAQGGDRVLLPIPLTSPLRRSYSMPVHLWARGGGYGTFDAKWLTLAPAVSAVAVSPEVDPPAPLPWQHFSEDSLMFGRHLWLGPQDLGGRFAVAALPDRLRFSIVVTDDDVSVATLSYPSAGDSVELYLDLRSDLHQGKPVFTEDVLALQIIAPTGTGEPVLWQAMQPLPEDLRGIEVTGERTADGYCVQVDLPLEPVMARRGRHWSGLGFDVGINDADAGGYRKTQMEWAGTPDNYLTPAYYAGLYLGEVPPGATRRTLR